MLILKTGKPAQASLDKQGLLGPPNPDLVHPSSLNYKQVWKMHSNYTGLQPQYKSIESRISAGGKGGVRAPWFWDPPARDARDSGFYTFYTLATILYILLKRTLFIL